MSVNNSKTNRFVRVKSKAKVKVSTAVVREQYLRTDLPCFSPECLSLSCARNSPSSTLPANASHYIIPLPDVIKAYVEILELPDITGLIFLQTVVDNVQQQGRKLYKQLIKIIQSELKRSIYFSNEFSAYTFQARSPQETLNDWTARLIFEAGKWYHEHLREEKPIVFITEDSSFIKAHSLKTIGIFVLPMKEYLTGFWPNLQIAIEIFDTVQASLQHSGNDEVTGLPKVYPAHLKENEMRIGLDKRKYIQGRLQVSRQHPQKEASVVREESSGDKDVGSDVLIAGLLYRNRAIHGDIVVVEILPKEKWTGKIRSLQSPENEEAEDIDVENQRMTCGRVVGILEHKWRDLVASFQEQTSNSDRSERVLVIPYDYRLPKIRILTRQSDLLKDCRIVIRLDSWPCDSQYPNGHLVKSLGPVGSLETEIQTLLLENSIEAAPFSRGVLKEMPCVDHGWGPVEADIASRRDLRDSRLIFSIDPQGCEDVDDALSIHELENGDIEMGVHIADVTHYVRPNSLTDLEARRRSTTVYLADRRLDMLPPVLSGNLCSLLGNQERYAVSVIWTMNQDYEIKDVWYGRSLIKSAYKMTYEAAQAILDDAQCANIVSQVPELVNLPRVELNARLKTLKTSLRHLTNIAAVMRSKRQSEGALELESTEVQFEFAGKETVGGNTAEECQIMQSKGELVGLKPKQGLDIHETVAEAMILANHWVAKKIADAFPLQALLRLHPPPKADQFEQLVQCAASKGFAVDTSSNKALADSLNQCVDPADSNVNFLLRSMATYAMVNALYFCTGSLPHDKWSHYGLALDYYTHFTSPIRRYADVIVHRLLLAAVSRENALKSEKIEECGLFRRPELEDLCRHINERHKAAQNAQRDSQSLFQALYFASKDPGDPECTCEAVICSLRSNGVIVFIPDYGIKGPVYLRNKDKQVVWISSQGVEWTQGKLQASDFALTVKTIQDQQTYKLFQHIVVKVEVLKSRAHPLTLKLSLIKLASSQQIRNDQRRNNMIEEVREISRVLSSKDEKQDSSPGPVQSVSKASLYDLFQEFRQMSLRG